MYKFALNQNNLFLYMKVEEPKEEWGGPWTEKKLDAFIKYVVAYLKIMNQQPQWKTIYFDGFAGSGERKKGDNENLLVELEITQDEENLYKGAAERVIRLEAPYEFDWYYFIEKEGKYLDLLKNKLSAYLQEGRNEKKKVVFRSGDCNEELNKLANALLSKKYAALLFLDPFGMQINWASIEGLKGTRCDIWILVPTGVIINRLLDRKGELRNIKKLESFFGLPEAEIRERFYKYTGQGNLFEEDFGHFQKVADPIGKIVRIYIENMKEIWKHVTDPPLRLNNRSGSPLFHFVFASNNTNALKIANYIIQNP